LKTYLFLEK